VADPRPGSSRTSGLNLGAFLVLSVLVGLFVLPNVFSTKSALVGKPAPDFALEVIGSADKGDRIHLAELKGRPVLIDFWASWCEACKVEAPVLDALARRHASRGLVVIGVATGDQPGDAARFAARHGLSYPIAYDAGDRVAATYGVSSLPTLVVIDASGNVTEVRTGYEGESALERIVLPLLQPPI
jgi:cytochrome c biogenesis protein CcmG, thiol:disulfide interchange protein DsbE